MDNKGYTNDEGKTSLSEILPIPIIIEPVPDEGGRGIEVPTTLTVTLTEQPQEDPVHRDKWGKDIEFLLSLIALSVGLGNVWRFPFVALENGGGAFVIPYIIVLILVGKPIYYMEMLLGQFSSRGNVKLYDFAPIMRGVGYGQTFSVAAVGTYYATLMALTIRYLYGSFAKVLPWSYCRKEWGDSCIDSGFRGNITGEGKKVPSAQFYFTHEILKEKTQIDDGIGAPSWELAICLFITWMMISIIIIKGVRSSGKASYFLAIFPYVVLIVLLLRAVTLPGAVDGILFFITPQWDQLLSAKVWYAAVTQAFFSLTICFGNIVIYSSFNRFDHNVFRDCNIVTTMDTLTSILSGVVIFGILGNLAYETQTDNIENVVQGGTGLAFISYPDAIAKFVKVPQIFSVLFFLMLFVLGLGSNVGIVSSLVTVIKDQFSTTKQWMIVIIIAICGFLIGLIFITPGGQFALNFVDFYAVTFVILCVGIAQLFAVSWIYGVKRFCADIEFMLNRKTGLYYRICWGIITPVLMTAILVYTLVDYKPLQYNEYTYPKGLEILGWCLSAFGVSQLIFWAVHGYISTPPGPRRFVRSFKPKPDWGPRERSNLKAYQNIVQEREDAEQQRKSWWFRLYDNVFG